MSCDIATLVARILSLSPNHFIFIAILIGNVATQVLDSFLKETNLFKFDTAVEGWIQCLTQQ